jgi:parvulin-like peptidyl-prolyl isomerase
MSQIFKGGRAMRLKRLRFAVMFIMVAVWFLTAGCSSNDDATGDAVPMKQGEGEIESSVILERSLIEPPVADVKQVAPGDVVISVNGKELKRSELQSKLRHKMNLQKNRIPADQRQLIEEGIRKQLIENFIMRTVLADEADSRNITANQEEIEKETSQIRSRLPSDKKLEDYFRENDIRDEDIALGIRVSKLVRMEAGQNPAPTQKEISRFYNENKERFTKGESVHVRHILLAINAGDDDETRAAKKAKIDDIRKQLLEGADFARMAALYSDCPSKARGGDLGIININQMVEPIEQAAFSQKVHEIGEVISTEYGHHVIEVLERHPARTVKLEDVKESIVRFLEQEREADAFERMTMRLRQNAEIIRYEK